MASELAAALAKVQAALPRINKEHTAEVEMRAGGKYKYKYADLADISAAILPRLAGEGLAWSCLPMLRDDGQFVLRYKLTHGPSGEELTGDYPLDRGKAQDVGGWITYARRYALGAVTGVATEDDTDGRGDPQPRQQRQQKPRAEANGHSQIPKDAPGSAAKGLITSIQIRYQELGFKRGERDDMLAASQQIIGRDLTGPHDGRTHNNLTAAEARQLRDKLGGFKERGDLLAALAETATP